MKSFISRLGGKNRLKNKIIKYFPEKTEYYIEPFAGSGILYFNYNKANIYVLNDLDVIIYKCFKAMKNNNYEIVNNLDWKYDETTFYNLSNKLLNQNFEDDLDCLYAYKYTSYYGAFGAPYSPIGLYNKNCSKKPYVPLDNYNSCYIKLLKDKTIILNENYLDIIKKYNYEDSFFYFDPPYYKMSNKHRYNNCNINFEEFFSMLSDIKGKFILSIDKEAHNTFGNTLSFNSIELDTSYSSSNHKTPQKVKEILINNF